MRQSSEERQLHCFPLLGRHPRQRAANLLDGDLPSCFFFQVNIERDHHFRDIGFRLALAQRINGAMSRDHRQPCPQAAAACVERFRLSPQLHEDLLHHVFRRSGISQDAQRNRIDDRGVAVVELRHRGFASTANTGDHLSLHLRRLSPRASQASSL